MKIGDYVRTEISSLNLQRIGKIKKIISEDFIHTDIGTYDKENIIKSSPSIIDLIEIGDYVNGSYIYSIVEENKNTGQPRVLFTEEDGLLGSGEIKSIITKEQFKNMEYKIKENNYEQ